MKASTWFYSLPGLHGEISTSMQPTPPKTMTVDRWDGQKWIERTVAWDGEKYTYTQEVE